MLFFGTRDDHAIYCSFQKQTPYTVTFRGYVLLGERCERVIRGLFRDADEALGGTKDWFKVRMMPIH